MADQQDCVYVKYGKKMEPEPQNDQIDVKILESMLRNPDSLRPEIKGFSRFV